MKPFDPKSMPSTTSPTVRNLRTFVERSIEAEIDSAQAVHGQEVAEIVEKSLRSLAYTIFHNNPKVHETAKLDMYAYDDSIRKLFAIMDDTEDIGD